MKALAAALVLALSLPAQAQSADAPVIVAPSIPLAPCQPGDVVLKPDAAVAVARRLAEAEAKVKVYEANPPFPVWAIVLLIGGGIALGGGAAVVFYEAKYSASHP